MNEEQLKESILRDVHGAKYWLDVFEKTFKEDDITEQNLGWIEGYIIGHIIQITKHVSAYEMLKSANKENKQ